MLCSIRRPSPQQWLLACTEVSNPTLNINSSYTRRFSRSCNALVTASNSALTVPGLRVVSTRGPNFSAFSCQSCYPVSVLVQVDEMQLTHFILCRDILNTLLGFPLCSPTFFQLLDPMCLLVLRLQSFCDCILNLFLFACQYFRCRRCYIESDVPRWQHVFLDNPRSVD